MRGRRRSLEGAVCPAAAAALSALQDKKVNNKLAAAGGSVAHTFWTAGAAGRREQLHVQYLPRCQAGDSGCAACWLPTHTACPRSNASAFLRCQLLQGGRPSQAGRGDVQHCIYLVPAVSGVRWGSAPPQQLGAHLQVSCTGLARVGSGRRSSSPRALLLCRIWAAALVPGVSSCSSKGWAPSPAHAGSELPRGIAAACPPARCLTSGFSATSAWQTGRGEAASAPAAQTRYSPPTQRPA